MMFQNDSLDQAGKLVAQGDLPGAIAQYNAVLSPLFERGQAGLAGNPGDAQIMIVAADELAELLRWDRQYDEAILLHYKMAHMLPEDATDYRIAAATLRIEMGDAKAGLELLEQEAKNLDSTIGTLVLGQSYAYLMDHPKAETHLRRACSDDATLPAMRAEASHLLFQILALQNKMPDAIDAWEVARSINCDVDAALPEMIRSLIYWYHYDIATKFIARDPKELRRTFYRTLIAGKSGLPKGREAWAWVNDYDPSKVTIEHEEFAQAAMHFASPQLALDVLMPRIENQGVMLRPMLLAGLAFAQQRDLARAHWALGKALRLADMARPRRTRQGSGTDRIFDAEARITYGELPIDPDVRAHLDAYFIPKQQLH